MSERLTISSYLDALSFCSIQLPEEPYFLERKTREKIPAVSPRVARLLYFFASLTKPKAVLEVGWGSGFSAYSIWQGCRESVKRFVSFEHEKNRFEAGRNYIAERNLPIELRNDDFEKAAPDIGEAFDFIFIDGVKRDYSIYFEQLKSLLVTGGIVIFDNILFNGRVLDESNGKADTVSCGTTGREPSGSFLLNEFNIQSSQAADFSFIYLELDDGIAVGLKK